MLHGLPDAFDQGLATRRAAGDRAAMLESLGQVQTLVETAVLEEICLRTPVLAEDMPILFRCAFHGSRFSDGWFGLFVRDAATRLTDDADFERIWNAEQLALLKAIVGAQSDKLDAMETANERRHREVMQEFARERGVDPKLLIPLFQHLGKGHLSLDEIRTRAGEAIKELIAWSQLAVAPSAEGAYIVAPIGAARAKVGALDTAAARSILAAKIAEEENARRARLLPLLSEQAEIERLSFDYEAAVSTFHRLAELEPDNIWHWIEVGDIRVTTGALEMAMAAYRQGLAIAERLAAADPGNAGWQRDVAVSNAKLGAACLANQDPAQARRFLLAGRAIMAGLVARYPDWVEWKRDLAWVDGQLAALGP